MDNVSERTGEKDHNERDVSYNGDHCKNKKSTVPHRAQSENDLKPFPQAKSSGWTFPVLFLRVSRLFGHGSLTNLA